MTPQRAVEFLREAAGYFERRPTNGEDMAFWSNVQNAENCRKIADMIERQGEPIGAALFSGRSRSPGVTH